jgi:hypothetical protein
LSGHVGQGEYLAKRQPGIRSKLRPKWTYRLRNAITVATDDDGQTVLITLPTEYIGAAQQRFPCFHG